MKKYILSIIAMAFGMLSAYAQSVSVSDATIKAGETKVISINLSNTQTNIVSFQMDLLLPNGITINKAGCSLGSRFTDASQELVIGKQTDGSFRLTSTSFNLKPISGTSGEIVKLSLTAANDAKGGTATLKDIQFATSNSENLTPSNASFQVSVPYTLTYKVDGEVYKTKSLVFGTKIVPEATPTKEGYTFSGWSEIPATMPNRDVEVTGTFAINSYTLTYKVDGEVYKTSTVAYGTALTAEEEPAKEGYTFSGWSEIPATMPAQDVEVSGSFSINSYFLFYVLDGSIYKAYSIQYGAEIVPEPIPDKEGHTFSGWEGLLETMPAHDVTLQGSFTINSYTLTYMVDGEEYSRSEVEYSTAITPLEEPSKEGYTFSGWSEMPTTMPANDVEVTGTFTINSYTLTYKVDGEEYKTSTVVFGSAITPEAAPTKEGHTFSGWSEIPATMPAHDVEVTGTFSINSYSLFYILDDKMYKTLNVQYGSTITPETMLTKEGYTFSGWSEIPATMPAHDVTVQGQYNINSHTLTYKVDDEVYKTYTLEYHASITPEPALTKEGYTFSGWSEIPELMPDNDVTVQGFLTINSYTLIYIVDGEEYCRSEVEYSTAITPLEEPTKEGYSFSGWSEISATMPAHDITVTGSFTINKYNLTYMVDGAVYKSYEIDYASTITPETAPTKEGHTFSGWSEIPVTMPANDVEVTGTFSINSYTLTYKVDGEVYKTETIIFGTEIVPEPAAIKEGYTFSGWSEIPVTMPANDVEVTGSFTINSYTLTYMVDGEVYKSVSVVYGTALILETEPTKEGYSFSGWSELPATMPAHDVEVSGSFSINNYFLFYVLDGSIYKACGIQYGSEIVPEPAPEKEGYTFSGWEGLPETMPAQDVTVQGSFSINSYTLTYMLDGEVFKTDTLVFGTAIVPEEELSKEGYTFSGWSEISTTMPAQDVIITGSFSVNSYTLSYIVDGEVYKTYEVEYGSTITPEAEPTKAGYTFSGWSEIPELMPANDVEVTGSFILKMAESIALDKESLLFNSTDAQQLNVTLTPSDLINNAVAWCSTDTTVVIVDEAGMVTPVGNGEAYIIACATDGTELKDSCKVTVDFKAATLTIDKEEVTIIALESLKLNASVTPEKASQVVTWSSSDESIVTVDEAGTIKPRRNGKAIITATTTDGTELTATCTVTVSIPSQFEVAVTQTTFTIQSKSGMAEAKDVKVTIEGEVYDLGDEGKMTGLAPGRTYHVEVTANIAGYIWTEELNVTMAEIVVNFDCNTSPTTLDISAIYDAGDATVTSASFEGEENVSSLNLTGLEPAQTYSFTYSITTEEGGTYTYESQFTTEALTLNISRTKIVSVGNVVVVATSNIAEEENVQVGFEWRRYDWPDEIQTKTGAAYIYAGTIEGSIKNLNADRFWKIRPYFLSQAGNRFLGDWVTIDPSDVSYFEPSVHTYNSISVEGNTAEVKGFVMQGSDDVESQGFMYWTASPQPSPKAREKVLSIPSNVVTVEAKGNMMVASLEGLEFETNYCYVAFAKTSEGKTFYGEQQTFTTGEMDPDGIEEIKNEELRMKNDDEWYDIQGRKLDKPTKGINIIRMSDGTTRKMMVK